MSRVPSGPLLFAACVFGALVIVGALWLRALTIDATTDRICSRVDALTAALISSATADKEPTAAQRVRIARFAEMAACDPDNLEPLLRQDRP